MFEHPESVVFFDTDFRTATLPDGTETTFTYTEAKVLKCLASRAGRVTTRATILDEIAEPGADVTDRSVDILVARIRRKLADDRTDPTFIATRYGEGYIWIAEAPATPDASSTERRFIAIGPVIGLDALGALEGRAERFLAALAETLADTTGERVTSNPEARDIGQAHSIQISFLRRGAAVECVVAARTGTMGQVVFVQRLTVKDDPRTDTLAEAIAAAIWSARTLDRAPLSALQVEMHEAAMGPTGGAKSWYVGERRLANLLADKPDDPMLKLMNAAHIQAKYVLVGWNIFAGDDDPREADIATIERHVLDALDFVQSHPDFGALAGKLLHFVGKGYGNLATELAEDALGKSTALTATFGTVAQLRGFRGDVDGAIALFDEALQLESDRGERRAWLLTLACQAALASGDRDRLARSRGELLRMKPKSAFLDLIMTDPDKPSLFAKAALVAISRRRAFGFLRNWWHIGGRLYADPDHRDRIMHAPVRLLTQRFGDDVLPPEVRTMK